MNKFLVIFLVCIGVNSFAQNTQRILDADEIVWFGVDFTQVKCIGYPEQFSDMYKIQSTHFNAINKLFVLEADKYNLKQAFKKKNIIFQVDSTFSRNENFDIQNIIQITPYTITDAQISDVVKNNTSSSENKLGLVFIAEALDKVNTKESIIITFFDIATGEVLLSHKYVATPKGIGFRNYWASGYYQLLINARSKLKSWIRKYNKSKK